MSGQGGEYGALLKNLEIGVNDIDEEEDEELGP